MSDLVTLQSAVEGNDADWISDVIFVAFAVLLVGLVYVGVRVERVMRQRAQAEERVRRLRADLRRLREVSK